MNLDSGQEPAERQSESDRLAQSTPDIRPAPNSQVTPTYGADSTDKRQVGGRNLPKAIAIGVLIVIIGIGALLISPWAFAVVLAVVVTAAIWELTNAFATAGIHVARTPLYIGGVISPFACYIYGLEAQVIIFGAIFVAILLWRIRRGTDGYVKDVMASVFIAGYLPFMVGFVMLSLNSSLGIQRIITFVALTIASDIGGFFAGVTFGKHPIAAKVSPKKSWEGLAGSFLLQAIVGAAFFVYLLDGLWWQGVITGLVMTVSATAGDFAESAIKRDLGIKDMSRLIPEHGGVMDRLDSLIPNAFVSWAMFTILLGP